MHDMCKEAGNSETLFFTFSNGNRHIKCCSHYNGFNGCFLRVRQFEKLEGSREERGVRLGEIQFGK